MNVVKDTLYELNHFEEMFGLESCCLDDGELHALIEEILDEEEDSYENMPEGIQNSEKGMNSEDAQESLSLAIESLEDAVTYLEDIN